MITENHVLDVFSPSEVVLQMAALANDLEAEKVRRPERDSGLPCSDHRWAGTSARATSARYIISIGPSRRLADRV